MTDAIETDGLAKRFGDTRALDGVDLRIRQGSVFGPATLDTGGASRFRCGSELVTLVADRTQSYSLAAGGYDDEGVPTRNGTW